MQLGCGTNLITPIQLKTLESVSRQGGWLSVTIMQRTGAPGKLLVLVGERHFIKNELIPVVSQLQQNFMVFAIEQGVPEKSWAKRFGLVGASLILGLPETLIVASLLKQSLGPAGRLKLETIRGVEPERTIVDIEANHQPSISENIAFVVLLTDASLSGICGWSGLMYSGHIFRPETGWVAAMAGLSWMMSKAYWYTLRRLYSDEDFISKKRLGYLNWLLPGRDKTMAFNLDNLSDATDGISVGVCGLGHVPGVIKELEKLGYSKTPLPKLGNSVGEVFFEKLLARVNRR